MSDSKELVRLADLDVPIAERRKKRDIAENKKFNLVYSLDEPKRQEPQSKKSCERGWYRVEGIIGHRITKVKNRESIELRVKWENYAEPTWEGFNGFVKDTGPMVERYLIKKSLMKPL